MDVSLLPMGRLALEATRPMAGERVIDVGCGCGGTTIELAERVTLDGEVLGVDISAPMLARAKSRIGSEKAVTLEHGDAQVYGFTKAAYDLVFSRCGVMFFSDPVAAFCNLRSALKPGGRLAFVCWPPARENAWVKIPAGIVKTHLDLPPPPGPDEPGEFAFADRERVHHILSTAGFAGIKIDRHDLPITIAPGGGLDQAAEFFLEMGPTGRAIADAEASDELKPRIAADLRDGLLPFVTEEGIVMDASIWLVTAHAG
ncbi:MAG: class I SAM-dependent methyltransferase [Alphaproteobacteria bacterium]